MRKKTKEKLKFLAWVDKFNKACDLLDIISELSLSDLQEFYLLGWDYEILARSLEEKTI